jgi:hypothetical protein
MKRYDSGDIQNAAEPTALKRTATPPLRQHVLCVAFHDLHKDIIFLLDVPQELAAALQKAA